MHARTPGRGPGRGRRVRARRLRRLQGVGGPALATATTAALAGGTHMTTSAIVAASYVAARIVRRPVRRHMVQLPLMRHLTGVLGTLLAVAALAVVASPSPAAVALVVCAFLVGTLLVDEAVRRTDVTRRRIVLVGPDPVALDLRNELNASAWSAFELIGRVSVGPADPPGPVPALGTLAELRDVVLEHEIDLIVLSPDIPRLPVFDRIANSCLELPVALLDLDDFCERALGR